MIAFQLIAGLICGIICASIASSKGRNAVGWFFIGFLFGIIPVIIVACLSNLNQEQAWRNSTERERRRLREQLRQERMKNEAFRDYSMGRFDAHDQALGMDTRSQQTALPGAGGGRTQGYLPTQQSAFPPVGSDPSPVPPADEAAAVWYYELSGNSVGPVSAGDIRRLIRTRQILSSTLLWTEGLADWTPLNQVSTFRNEVGP